MIARRLSLIFYDFDLIGHCEERCDEAICWFNELLLKLERLPRPDKSGLAMTSF